MAHRDGVRAGGNHVPLPGRRDSADRTDSLRPMALSKGWEHVYCGSVYRQRTPPAECEYCAGLLPRVLKGNFGPDWRRVPVAGKQVATGQRPTIGKNMRRRVYHRDGHRCTECGSKEEISLDHWMPWSRGGATTDANLKTMCRTCNSEKGDMTPAEWANFKLTRDREIG